MLKTSTIFQWGNTSPGNHFAYKWWLTVPTDVVTIISNPSTGKDDKDVPFCNTGHKDESEVVISRPALINPDVGGDLFDVNRMCAHRLLTEVDASGNFDYTASSLTNFHESHKSRVAFIAFPVCHDTVAGLMEEVYQTMVEPIWDNRGQAAQVAGNSTCYSNTGAGGDPFKWLRDVANWFFKQGRPVSEVPDGIIQDAITNFGEHTEPMFDGSWRNFAFSLGFTDNGTYSPYVDWMNDIPAVGNVAARAGNAAISIPGGVLETAGDAISVITDVGDLSVSLLTSWLPDGWQLGSGVKDSARHLLDDTKELVTLGACQGDDGQETPESPGLSVSAQTVTIVPTTLHALQYYLHEWVEYSANLQLAPGTAPQSASWDVLIQMTRRRHKDIRPSSHATSWEGLQSHWNWFEPNMPDIVVNFGEDPLPTTSKLKGYSAELQEFEQVASGSMSSSNWWSPTMIPEFNNELREQYLSPTGCETCLDCSGAGVIYDASGMPANTALDLSITEFCQYAKVENVVPGTSVRSILAACPTWVNMRSH